MLLRAVARFHHTHPDVVARQDALLTGIYRLLRTVTGRLCPEAELPPDVADMTPGWLIDLVALAWEKGRGEERLIRELKTITEQRRAEG